MESMKNATNERKCSFFLASWQISAVYSDFLPHLRCRLEIREMNFVDFVLGLKTYTVQFALFLTAPPELSLHGSRAWLRKGFHREKSARELCRLQHIYTKGLTHGKCPNGNAFDFLQIFRLYVEKKAFGLNLCAKKT